jgi:hypothetical protein
LSVLPHLKCLLQNLYSHFSLADRRILRRHATEQAFRSFVPARGALTADGFSTRGITAIFSPAQGP